METVEKPKLVQLDGIRRFDNVAIQAAVDRALAALPEGKQAAVVAHGDLQGNLSLSIAFKLGDKWSITGACIKEYNKPIKGEAQVVFTPF